MAYNVLNNKEKQIINKSGTETPFQGEYDDFYKKGIFICRKCNFPLFSSKAKFNAGCGWPAFDQNFPKAIKRLLDIDGVRVEIKCANCGAHLGHVFEGEKLTKSDTRHCVNSLSINFFSDEKKLPEVLYE